VLSKCLNPACSAKFRYLHEGRIFKLEIASVVPKKGSPRGRIEHFWLCPRCAQELGVVLDNGSVTIRPLPQSKRERMPEGHGI
jgi:hypothetical protein